MEHYAGKERYLSIQDDLVLVKGASNSALYDIKHDKIYHINEQLARILSLSQQQIPVNDMYSYLAQESPGSEADIIRTVLEHPFLSLSRVPTNIPEAKDLKPLSKPDFLWLEITTKCNLNCIHCYAESGKDGEDGLSTSDYRRVIKEAFHLGFTRIQFTGGEPTLHPDLMELLGYAKTCGYEFIELYTNAVSLPYGLLNFAVKNRINIATSFYSYSRQTHVKITRGKGSFEKTVENIKRIAQLKIPLRVGIIRLKYNQDHTQKTREFLMNLGVSDDAMRVDTVRPTGRGCNLTLIPQDESEFTAAPVSHSIQRSANGLTIPGTCWNGKLAITPSGEVIPCVFARDLVVGNVLTSALKDIVSSRKLNELWQITLDRVEHCKDCEYRYACFDCRAYPYSVTKDLLARWPSCSYNPYAGQWGKSDEEGIMQITEDYKPIKNGVISTRVIDGETILFNTQSNALHALNTVASEIWNFCDGKHSYKEIVDRLFDRFEASRQQIEKDVQKTLVQFQELELLQEQ